MRALFATVAGFVAGVLIALAADPAAAQGQAWSMSEEYSGKTPSAAYQPPSYTPTPHSAIQNHSSTYFEGAARGISGIMKAYADGMLSLSQARILMAEAAAREMQNEVIKSQTFFERKEVIAEERREARRKHWEFMEEVAEYKAEREQKVLLTEYHIPITQLDRLTGEIRWPAALSHPNLTQLREKVEAAFAQLATQEVGVGTEYAFMVAKSVDELRDMLRQCREPLGVEWSAYFGSQRFLVGLKYEAQFWGESDLAASVAETP